MGTLFLFLFHFFLLENGPGYISLSLLVLGVANESYCYSQNKTTTLITMLSKTANEKFTKILYGRLTKDQTIDV